MTALRFCTTAIRCSAAGERLRNTVRASPNTEISVCITGILCAVLQLGSRNTEISNFVLEQSSPNTEISCSVLGERIRTPKLAVSVLREPNAAMGKISSVMRLRTPVLAFRVSAVRRRISVPQDPVPVMRSASPAGYELSGVSPGSFR